MPSILLRASPASLAAHNHRAAANRAVLLFDSVSGGGRRWQAACGPLRPGTGMLPLLPYNMVLLQVPEMLLSTCGIAILSPN